MLFSNRLDGKLVETLTSDGLRLHGFYQRSVVRDLLGGSNQQEISHSDRDCWLIVHGVAGNFYNSSLLGSVAESLLANGSDVLRINTRGRDPISYVAVGSMSSRCGAAYETVSDGILDISSWFQLLLNEGYRSINLLGHSLGAVKSILFACEHPIQTDSDSLKSQTISRLVLLSPPRLQPDIIRTDTKYSATYLEDLAQARQLCEAGKPDSLLTIRYPQPMIVSASTFLDKYGSDSRYDYHRYVSLLKSPTLWCFGEHEVRGPRASFRDADNELVPQLEMLPKQTQTLKVIPSGDHAYTGVRDLLCDSVIEWTKTTVLRL